MKPRYAQVSDSFYWRRCVPRPVRRLLLCGFMESVAYHQLVFWHRIKRVSAVKLKRSTEKSGHTYHSARLQLWHEKPPSDSLLPDTASGLTGISQATRARLALQWSRLVIYLGGSDCFITCFG